MSLLILRHSRVSREGPHVVVPVLLAAILTVAVPAQGSECPCSQCPPLQQGNVLIGHLAELTEAPTELQTVEVLFEHWDTNLLPGEPPQEEYTLKVFEVEEAVGSVPIFLLNPWLVGEQSFLVDKESPVPPTTAKWELVELGPLIWTGEGHSLIVIDMTRQQLQESTARLLFAEGTSREQARTYFSVDGGSCWCPLGEVDLAYLFGDETVCLLDDSIYIKIHVKPN